MGAPRRLLRDNLFLVAAVALPLVVVMFFLVATAIPRWTVAAPAYDLVFTAPAPYAQARPRIAVDLAVRNGRVEATARAVPDDVYVPRSLLYLFDHRTMEVREVQLELPDTLAPGAPPHTVVVAALAGRRLTVETNAPDGYEMRSRGSGSPGLVGDVFGINRYRGDAALVHRGRVVPLTLPAGRYSPGPPTFLGWIVDDGR